MDPNLPLGTFTGPFYLKVDLPKNWKCAFKRKSGLFPALGRPAEGDVGFPDPSGGPLNHPVRLKNPGCPQRHDHCSPPPPCSSPSSVASHNTGPCSMITKAPQDASPTCSPGHFHIGSWKVSWDPTCQCLNLTRSKKTAPGTAEKKKLCRHGNQGKFGNHGSLVVNIR